MGNCKDKVIRLSVGDSENACSSIWRIWFNKPGEKSTSDVYLSYRTLGGIQKVSIHETGDIQFSFTSEYAKKMDIANSYRHLDRWTIQNTSPIFKIIVPYTELKKSSNNYLKDIRFIPKPNEGSAIEIFLYILNGSITKFLPPNFNFIEEQTLNNNKILSLIWRDNPITRNNKELYLNHKRILLEKVRNESLKGADLRGVLFMNNNGNERGFIDLAL